jgi:hypothetical protein
MMEEEVFVNKQLRDPEEARRTITKIIVIITIAVSIEGLVYIFKAGTKDISNFSISGGVQQFQQVTHHIFRAKLPLLS